MYSFEISDELEGKLIKLLKKNKPLYDKLFIKIHEIANSENVEHYKNLKYNLKNLKRVHVGHFVLIFCFDNNKNHIIFEDFDHHDKIYL